MLKDKNEKNIFNISNEKNESTRVNPQTLQWWAHDRDNSMKRKERKVQIPIFNKSNIKW